MHGDLSEVMSEDVVHHPETCEMQNSVIQSLFNNIDDSIFLEFTTDLVQGYVFYIP